MATDDDDVPGGKAEHLKLIQGAYDMVAGHLDGLAAEMNDEAKTLIGVAMVHLHAGYIVALHTVEAHLPDTK